MSFPRSKFRYISSAVLVLSSLSSISCLKKASLPSESARTQAYTYIGGGGGGGGDRAGLILPEKEKLLAADPQSPVLTGDRKIVRNGALDLLVADVGNAVGKIRSVVDGMGGFVEKSTQTNTGGHSAAMTIRVPASRLDQAMLEIKKVATTVDRENLEARDVTRDYVDLDARLRNAQAEEAQYLQILKRAVTVKDTLDVSEKLSDVRGRIEEMQGEMKYLTAQIEMSSVDISLRVEAEAAVVGIHWRPLRQSKIALGEMLSGLADWADSVIAFFINLPLIIVWVVSIMALAMVAFRVLRFVWRKFGPKTAWHLPWRHAGTDTEPSSK